MAAALLLASASAVDFRRRGEAWAHILGGDMVYLDLADFRMDPDERFGLIAGGLINLQYVFTHTSRQIHHAFPFSLRLADFLRMRLLFQTVAKSDLDAENTDIASRGFGDLSLNFRLRFGSPRNFFVGPSLWLKLPTGATEEFGVKIPIGTGSVDWIPALTFGHRMDRTDFTATFAYRFNGTHSRLVKGVEMRTQRGRSVYYSAGAEVHPIPKIQLGLHLSGVSILEGFEPAPDGTRVSDNGRIVTLDVVPTVRYSSSDQTAQIFLRIFAPAKTWWPASLSVPGQRKVLIQGGTSITF